MKLIITIFEFSLTNVIEGGDGLTDETVVLVRGISSRVLQEMRIP